MKGSVLSSILPTTLVLRCVFAILGFLAVAGTSSEAHAGRGILVINTGEDAMSIQPIPESAGFEQPTDGEPLQAGIKYSRFGVFFLDIARWNSEFCIFSEDASGFSYQAATPAELAAVLGVSEAEIKRPLRYYLPPGGVILGLLVLIGGPLFLWSMQADKKRRATLLSDPRYQAAVSLFNSQTQLTPDQRLAEAANYLASSDIPHAVATENLRFLCDISDE